MSEEEKTFEEKAIILDDNIEQMIEKMDVSAVFGKPIKSGDVTIIPVADITFAFGYGYGQGRGEEEEGEAPYEEKLLEEGGGGGGGGSVSARGCIEITPEGVRFVPVVNVMRLALASMLMVAWCVFWIMQTIRAVGASEDEA